MKRTAPALRALLVAGLLALCAAVPTMSASAATTTGWADWDPLSGSAGDWSTTVRLPAEGFPEASVTSDSRGGVGVISGASSWLGAGTPPGERFGSSKGQQYLNLRPQADRPTAPSTTTYTFDRPTPAGGWAFVLGDLDADRATVTAHGADGRLLTGAELGWQGGFNYCTGAGSPSCSGDESDVATWDPATGQVVGNAAAADTSGAAGWFEPTTPIASLTVEFYQRSGFPVYQTWFAAVARDLSGTVRLVDGAGTPQGELPGATLTLFGPDGTELATTTSDEEGRYTFPGYAAAPGYSVELTTLPEADDEHPFGFVPSGELTVTEIDLSDADATDVDLAAREIQPVAVRGTVLTDDGAPVRGATVTLTPVGGGDPRTAVTSSTGEYLIDQVPWDTASDRPQDYTFAVSDLPDGYATATVPDDLTVDVDQEEPSTGNDFVVRAPAAVSGAVTAGGEPVVGVVVTRSGPGGSTSTTTDADGTYRFDEVLTGEHTVRITLPDGYAADGPATRDVTVAAADVPDVDFVLARHGTLGGVVTDAAGEPVVGATLTVTGPGGPVTVPTDELGGYFVGELPPGEHTVTLTVPDGYTADVTERTVTVTDAGENWLEENFSVARAAVADPEQPVGSGGTHEEDAADVGATGTDPEGTKARTATSDADGGWDQGGLAATGAAVGSVALVAAALLTCGTLLVRASRRSRRS